MSEQRSNLYLLTGLIIGLGLGLLIAWVIIPVKYVDTEPSTLVTADKDAYQQVIALAYQSSHDLGRAKLRIELVNPGSSFQVLAAQAQRMLAEDNSSDEARALAQLAADLSASQQANLAITPNPPPTIVPEMGGMETVVSTISETPATATATTPRAEVAAIQTATPPPPTASPTNTPTPQPTFTPQPTSTPVRIQSAPFRLKNRTEICDNSIPLNLLQVQVIGTDGQPLPGIRISILWKEQQEVFYTGLAPEINPGYADFLLDADTVYSLKIGEVSETLDNLTVNDRCGILLEFTQEKDD